jgi:xanthine dehydrogenase YagS FAD-binding subunit
LGASLTIAGPAGTRKVNVADFFVAPSSGDQREIDLKPNEIVTEILIPSGATKNAIYEVRQKEGLDWPLVAAAVALKMKGNTIESAQVVLGHVGPTPVVAAAAGSALAGKSISEETAAAAGAAAVQGAMPLSGNAYKVDLVKVAVKRALLAAAKA